MAKALVQVACRGCSKQQVAQKTKSSADEAIKGKAGVRRDFAARAGGDSFLPRQQFAKA
jgi:hypothetical protein